MPSLSTALPTPANTSALALPLDRVAFALLLGALIWAPWPLGSNRPWAVASLAALVWAGVMLAALASAMSPTTRGSLPRGAWLPLGALLGFALLVAAQLVPALGGGGTGLISIDPVHTRGYLLETAVYGGAWLLVLLTVRTPERGVSLLAAVLVAGVLQAIAAVLLYSAGTRYELFFMPFDQGGRAMGTYPSPDNLAGYMELTLSAGLGWLLSQLSTEAGSSQAHWRSRVVAVLTFMMSGKMLLRLLLVVLVIVLVMTHSRMGNAAFFVSLGLTAALVAVRMPTLRRPALWLVASMALVDLFIIGQWVGLERVVQRVKNTAEASSETVASFGLTNVPPPREESILQRLEVPRLALGLVEQRPWLGHGGGTFYTAIPPLKREGLPWYWDHAHNDYVQVACDTGLVGLALWLTIGVASVWRAARLLHQNEARVNRGFGVAAVMATSCMGLHSIVDFNLHIPANALTFTVLLAAVWALPATARRRRRTPASASGGNPQA